MKTEITKDDHCPYCKRHCSLISPHCRKGKELAEKKMKKEPLKEAAVTVEIPIQWEALCGEIRLYRSLEKVSKEVIAKKNSSEIYKKDRFYLLALLAGKGQASRKYLEETMDQDEKGLNELLHKLEKKEWISCGKNEQGEKNIVITEKGLKAAGELQKARIEEGNVFTVLTEEEKKTMEGILKKIMG